MPERLNDLRMVDPVLSTIAQGYSNAGMVADFLFPHVPVEKMKGKVPSFGKESFIIRNTDRAIRSASNRIPPSDLNYIEYETLEHDIETAMDYLEIEEAFNAQMLEQHLTKELMDILLLGREKTAADIAQSANNYISDLKKVITALNAWDDYTITTVDPIMDILDGKTAIRQLIGIYPNTMIIGETAYKALVNHPKVTARVEFSGLAKVGNKALSELLEIPNIHVGMSVYSTDGETFTDVWTDNVILAYVDKSDKSRRSEYNPSYGYTFRKKNNPVIDTYEENGSKIKVIRNTDNYCVKVTATDAAYLISDTNHL
jgi:sRNA-binding regulator protein Hfq